MVNYLPLVFGTTILIGFFTVLVYFLRKLPFAKLGLHAKAQCSLLIALVCYSISLGAPIISSQVDIELSRSDFDGIVAAIGSETYSEVRSIVGSRWVPDDIETQIARKASNVATSVANRYLNDANMGKISRSVESYLASERGLGDKDFYLLDVLADLYRGADYVIFVIILAFSVLFPISKLAVAGLLTTPFIENSLKNRVAGIIDRTAKYSMGDVFVLALFVVIAKAEGLGYRFNFEMGCWGYIGGFVFTNLATREIKTKLGLGRSDSSGLPNSINENEVTEHLDSDPGVVENAAHSDKKSPCATAIHSKEVLEFMGYISVDSHIEDQLSSNDGIPNLESLVAKIAPKSSAGDWEDSVSLDEIFHYVNYRRRVESKITVD